MQLTLSSPEITCDHCIATIERTVGAVDGARFVRGDADARQFAIEVEHGAVLDAVAAALDVFGHPGNGDGRSLKRECLQLFVAAGFHAFAFDRHGMPLRSIRTAAQLLRNGWNVLMYPEGTRSRTGRMAPFKPGVGVLARFTGRPVVPVHVSGGRRILPCGATVPRPGRVAVRYGAALYFEAGETALPFTARLQEAVHELGSIEIA